MIRAAQYVLKPTKGQGTQAGEPPPLPAAIPLQRGPGRAEIAWEDNKRRIKRFDQFAALNGLSETNPDLAQYGITVARGTLTRLDLAFKSFFRRCRKAGPGDKPGYPRFKGATDGTRWPTPIPVAGRSIPRPSASTSRGSATSGSGSTGPARAAQDPHRQEEGQALGSDRLL